jgi:hypothetical protein
MSELRIGTANSEPAAGTLKVGSGDVQEIYLGSTKIWPSTPAPDPSADVCGIEFTTANTSITAVTSGPTIVIATDASDWVLKFNQGIPAAAYYNYDIANASRGLYYNKYAYVAIQPPTGFRKPNVVDITTLITSPCSDTSVNPENRNSLATSVGTGGWNESLFTNTTDRGISGLNIAGYGYLSRFAAGTFIENQTWGGFWYGGATPSGFVIGKVLTQYPYMTYVSIYATSPAGFNIRFCKDL